MSSGANRRMSFAEWKEEEERTAALSGRRAHVPPVDRNGVPLDIAHYADPDEALEWAQKIVARHAQDDEIQKRAKAIEAQMGEDLKKGVATGDPEAIRSVVQAALLQLRDTDPNMWPTPVPTPGDFANEFGTPVDPTEIIALCEELGLYTAFPEIVNGSRVESWRELTQLEFASGCDSCAFTPGECPEDSVHHTDTESVTKRHFGVKKSLTESDIRHSIAAIAGGVGVSALIGAFNDKGLPGELDAASLIRGGVADLKEKELRLAMILVLNCWDDLLVNGDNGANPLEFDGITNSITVTNGARACPNWMTGTFSAANFDRFLSAGCANPQAILGHPTALAEIALGYYAIGSQTVFFDRNEGIVPGLNFASQIMAGLGPIALIGDSRFPRVAGGDGSFTTIVYPVRLTHNGEPLIYKATQIPLSAKDLTPGCTAVAFEVWAVSALVVKAMCAQALCQMDFSGMIDDGCTYVHPCTPATLPS
ncbi:MAG: hypothetical protein A2V88_08970 [Elusimicrobia bacterium RBG_16_66_12]|nr:MAG: hypothetical protein A2V88_08970 [Elusimicrobia bacterium RBG_16_66_12]